MGNLLDHNILRQIIQTAEAIKSSIPASVEDLRAGNPGQEVNTTLTLPSYPSILDELIHIGVPIKASRSIAAAFASATIKLKERTETKFQETSKQLVASAISPFSFTELQNRLRQTFESVYLRKCEAWAADARNRAIGSYQATTALDTKSGLAEQEDGRQQFNHKYLPVLEAFFTEEQFPSRADKQYIAKKSGMTYKQIHVWFQNRRSRTRKQSVSTTRSLMVNRGMSLPSSSHDTDTEEDNTYPSSIASGSSSFTLVNEEVYFAQVALPHSFPTKYPPDVDKSMDPFPCRFGDFSGFHKPTWMRSHSAYLPKHDVIDIDTLCKTFSNLRISTTIAEDSKPPLTWGQSHFRKLDGCDVYSPYVVRPLSAPLVSLVRGLPVCVKPGPPKSAQASALRSDDCPGEDGTKPTTVEERIEGLQNSQRSTGALRPRTRLTEEPSSAQMSRNTSKKKSGLPRRVPSSRPVRHAASSSLASAAQHPSLESQRQYALPRQHHFIPANAPIFIGSTDSTASKGSTLVLSSPVAQSCTPPLQSPLVTQIDLRHVSSPPSFSSSLSSRSSSESHSPSTPILDFPDERVCSFALPSDATIDMATCSVAPQKAFLSPLFPSTDFFFDHSSLNLPIDDSYNLPFSHFDNNDMYPSPTSYEPSIPTSLPLTFDFSTLV